MKIQQKSYYLFVIDNSFLWDETTWLLEDPKETAGSDEHNSIQLQQVNIIKQAPLD